jgi:hypothetical protein
MNTPLYLLIGALPWINYQITFFMVTFQFMLKGERVFMYSLAKSSVTLFISDVLHGQSFQVEDDGCLYYCIWYALVLVRLCHHSPNAALNKINDVHDEISLLSRSQNAFHVRHSVSSDPHWKFWMEKWKKIFQTRTFKMLVHFVWLLQGLCILSRPTRLAEKYFFKTSGGLKSFRIASILWWRRHSKDCV